MGKNSNDMYEIIINHKDKSDNDYYMQIAYFVKNETIGITCRSMSKQKTKIDIDEEYAWTDLVSYCLGNEDEISWDEIEQC